VTLPRAAERLTIYLEETAHHGRVAEFVGIIERARALGMAGAIGVQGIEGFGGSARIHRRHSLSLKEDVPVVITIVDTPERIDRFLPEVERLMPRGLVLRQPVEVVLHRGAEPSSRRPGDHAG
jgi:PII-like signaling protein